MQRARRANPPWLLGVVGSHGPELLPLHPHCLHAAIELLAIVTKLQKQKLSPSPRFVATKMGTEDFGLCAPSPTNSCAQASSSSDSMSDIMGPFFVQRYGPDGSISCRPGGTRSIDHPAAVSCRAVLLEQLQHRCRLHLLLCRLEAGFHAILLEQMAEVETKAEWDALRCFTEPPPGWQHFWP